MTTKNKQELIRLKMFNEWAYTILGFFLIIYGYFNGEIYFVLGALSMIFAEIKEIQRRLIK